MIKTNTRFISTSYALTKERLSTGKCDVYNDCIIYFECSLIFALLHILCWIRLNQLIQQIWKSLDPKLLIGVRDLIEDTMNRSAPAFVVCIKRVIKYVL